MDTHPTLWPTTARRRTESKKRIRAKGIPIHPAAARSGICRPSARIQTNPRSTAINVARSAWRREKALPIATKPMVDQTRSTLSLKLDSGFIGKTSPGVYIRAQRKPKLTELQRRVARERIGKGVDRPGVGRGSHHSSTGRRKGGCLTSSWAAKAVMSGTHGSNGVIAGSCAGATGGGRAASSPLPRPSTQQRPPALRRHPELDQSDPI